MHNLVSIIIVIVIVYLSNLLTDISYETHNARAGWDAESEIGSEMGDVEEVTTTANRVAVRTPVVQRGLGRPIPAISRNEIGGSGRGRDNESATRGRGRGTTTDVRGRGRGRGIDRGSSSNGSHRGGGVSRGNLRGNAGRGGHHSVPTGRGNGTLKHLNNTVMDNTDDHQDDWLRVLLGEDTLAMVLAQARYLQVTIVPTSHYLVARSLELESQA